MAVLKIVLMVILIAICIALTVIILLQEGKSAGLGGIMNGGGADTYWSKNKGRSMEGFLVKLTRVCVIFFLVIAAVLNMGIF